MTTYSAADLTKEARRAVKHAKCYACGGFTGKRNTYQRWTLSLGNGSGHAALVAYFLCHAGHATQTNIAI